MSHAFVGVLTCARIHSIELDRERFPFQPSPCGYSDVRIADEGGATSMSGGIPWLTLPAGYLGSGLIGAALIACGFDTNASKVASLVLAVFFIFTLWWARRNLLCVFFGFFLGGLDGWMADGSGVDIIGLGSFCWECRV